MCLRELCRYAVYAVGELMREHLKFTRVNFRAKHYRLAVHSVFNLTQIFIGIALRLSHGCFQIEFYVKYQVVRHNVYVL